MIMLDYKGEGDLKNLGKNDYVICERSQTQNHIFLEFQRIKTFQTLHQGV